MIVKQLTEHNLEFLSLNRGCRGSSQSTLVKISHCRKFHALAQLYQNVVSRKGFEQRFAQIYQPGF